MNRPRCTAAPGVRLGRCVAGAVAPQLPWELARRLLVPALAVVGVHIAPLLAAIEKTANTEQVCQIKLDLIGATVTGWRC